jgi:hypothetical protein
MPINNLNAFTRGPKQNGKKNCDFISSSLMRNYITINQTVARRGTPRGRGGRGGGGINLSSCGFSDAVDVLYRIDPYNTWQTWMKYHVVEQCQCRFSSCQEWRRWNRSWCNPCSWSSSSALPARRCSLSWRLLLRVCMMTFSWKWGKGEGNIWGRTRSYW